MGLLLPWPAVPDVLCSCKGSPDESRYGNPAQPLISVHLQIVSFHDTELGNDKVDATLCIILPSYVGGIWSECEILRLCSLSALYSLALSSVYLHGPPKKRKKRRHISHESEGAEMVPVIPRQSFSV